MPATPRSAAPRLRARVTGGDRPNPRGWTEAGPASPEARREPKIRRTIIAGAAVAALALIPVTANAAPGWRTVASDSDVGRYSSLAYAGTGANQTTAARLEIRTNRPMRVRVETSVSCHDADYLTSASVDLPRSSRIVRPGHPWVRVYGPTFPTAADCLVSSFVTGGRGRLTVTMAVPS